MPFRVQTHTSSNHIVPTQITTHFPLPQLNFRHRPPTATLLRLHTVGAGGADVTIHRKPEREGPTRRIRRRPKPGFRYGEALFASPTVTAAELLACTGFEAVELAPRLDVALGHRRLETRHQWQSTLLDLLPVGWSPDRDSQRRALVQHVLERPHGEAPSPGVGALRAASLASAVNVSVFPELHRDYFRFRDCDDGLRRLDLVDDVGDLAVFLRGFKSVRAEPRRQGVGRHIRHDFSRALASGFEEEDDRRASVVGGEIWDDAGSAERAGGVRQEPGVDAFHVEGVAAFGEQPELVLGVELAETYGTVEWVLEADDGVVVEDGEGVDEGLVDAGVVEVEELPELTLQGGDAVGVIRVPGGGGGGGTVQEQPHQQVEKAAHEEDDGDNDDD